MNQTNDTNQFRDRLIQSDAMTNQTSARLAQDIQSMFHRRLSNKRRTLMAAISIGALTMAILCGTLAVTESGLPMIPRVGLAVGSLIGLCWMIFAGRLCYRGQMDLKIDPHVAASMVWCFTLLLVIFFLIAAANFEDRQKGILLVLNGLAFLIGASTYWINYKLEQSQLMTKEHLLRIELQLSQRQQ